MSTYQYTQKYTIKTDAGIKVILTKQDDTDYTIILEGNAVPSVTVGSISSTSPQSLTIEIASNASAYSNAIMSCQYAPISAWNNQDSSQCNLCFNLTDPGGNSYWSITGVETQGDNLSIFPSSQPGASETVEITVPTKQNPNTHPSPQPVLDPNMVFLLDIAGNSLVFRGNSPLGEKTSENPQQNIDFPKFIAALDSAFHKATGLHLPADGGYEICIIALLSQTGEDDILIPEIASFGGTKEQLSQSWYPSVSNIPYPIPALTNVTGRMCQWNVNPAGTKNGNYVNMVSQLATEMNNWIYKGLGGIESDISKPRIFYIHCASGHDRTGMMCTSYLTQKKILFKDFKSGDVFSNQDLTETFIMGTTLNKIPYRNGQYAPDCYDIHKPNQKNPNKSRCFLISGAYNQTVAWAADKLSGNPESSLSLSADALSGDPLIKKYAHSHAYVETDYPWTDETASKQSLLYREA